MRKNPGGLRSVLPVLHLLLAMACFNPLAAEKKGMDVAPHFELPDHASVTHSLADNSGKIIVLEWINFDCPFVKNHYDNTGAMPALQKAYREQGVVWISICSSAEGKQGNFTSEEIGKRIKKTGWAGDHYLIDAEGQVGKAYGAKTTPHMIVIDADGKIVYDGAIDSQPGFSKKEFEAAEPWLPPVLDALLAGDPLEARKTRPYGCSVKY